MFAFLQLMHPIVLQYK